MSNVHNATGANADAPSTAEPASDAFEAWRRETFEQPNPGRPNPGRYFTRTERDLAEDAWNARGEYDERHAAAEREALREVEDARTKNYVARLRDVANALEARLTKGGSE